MTDISSLHVTTLGQGPTQLIWAHGWGQDGGAFAPTAQSLAGFCTNYLFDFPGFGKTPFSGETWGTRNYADYIAQWLRTLPPGKKLWIGHSFGGRVGLQMAAHHPDLIDGLVLVGTAGIPPKRTAVQRMNNWVRVYTFKAMKLFVPEGPKRDALRARFGSADYRRAGALRPTFVKVVNENLMPEAAAIAKPTLIICGAKDDQAPPNISERLHNSIAGSAYHLLPGFDHYTILSDGRHQVAALIKGFLESKI
ncbi:MAG TPA: alpha/beta hydrolase [Alphaproteobacteria bacterium]